MSTTHPSVVCIGSAGRDIFFPLDNARIYNTPEDLTAQKHLMLELGAKYRTEDRYEAPGGCSLNTSLALARLDVRSVAYCVVGDDTYGEEIIEDLLREGVGTHCVTRAVGVGTDVSCILVDTKSAERVIVYNRDANERLEVRKELFPDVQEVFVSGMYGNWKKNLASVRRYARTQKTRLYYNPGQKNIAVDPAEVQDTVSMSEIVFLNKDEAIELVMKSTREIRRERLEDEKFLTKSLVDMGVKCAVVTDGDRGAWAHNGGACYFVRAKRIRAVVDSTGAGDAFTGAFLAAYLHGGDMAECLRWGVANGGSVVQHYGAKEGLLTKKEIIAATETIKVEVI